MIGTRSKWRLPKTLATRKEYNIDHRIILPDGTQRFLHELSTLVYDEQTGRPVKMLGTTQDITERKQTELAMAQALKAEKELNELKSRFVSIASHEFRTPLASVLASAELLLRYRSRMNEERVHRKN